MTEKVLLKDLLFNEGKVKRIAGEIRCVYPSFNENKFVRDVLAKFSQLELKARISWISECFKAYLPRDYPSAVDILLNALPASNNPECSDGDFGDFIYASYAEFVAANGCTKRHLQHSLSALYEMTKRFSAEDAIRYFINAFPKETLGELLSWTQDPPLPCPKALQRGNVPKASMVTENQHPYYRAASDSRSSLRGHDSVCHSLGRESHKRHFENRSRPGAPYPHDVAEDW